MTQMLIRRILMVAAIGMIAGGLLWMRTIEHELNYVAIAERLAPPDSDADWMDRQFDAAFDSRERHRQAAVMVIIGVVILPWTLFRWRAAPHEPLD